MNPTHNLSLTRPFSGGVIMTVWLAFKWRPLWHVSCGAFTPHPLLAWCTTSDHSWTHTLVTWLERKNTGEKACVKLLYSQYSHAKNTSQLSTGKGIKQINFVNQQRVKMKNNFSWQTVHASCWYLYYNKWRFIKICAPNVHMCRGTQSDESIQNQDHGQQHNSEVTCAKSL